MKLEWNVYRENFNKKQIEVFNIFHHESFAIDCELASKECMTKEEFKKRVKNSLMYYFWSKCEYEIILSDWPPSKCFNEEKVSVYDQVMINFDRFIDYLWEFKKENTKR